MRPRPENRDLLISLIDSGRLDIRTPTAVDELPQFSIAGVRRERWRGMLLGLAIGDALGNTSEGVLPRERRATYGEILDYLPNRHADYRRVGLPSDDTQLAFRTIEQMLADGYLDPAQLAVHFAAEPIFGIGSSVRAFLKGYSHHGDWARASSQSAGNGALMRIAPIVLPHIGRGSNDLWVDAILGGAVTHNDTASISACVAVSGILSKLLMMVEPPAQSWWVETYLALARPIEADTLYRPRGGRYLDFAGAVSAFVARYVPDAVSANLDVRAAGNSWYRAPIYSRQSRPFFMSWHVTDMTLNRRSSAPSMTLRTTTRSPP